MEVHRLEVEGFLRCEREAVEIRRVVDERRERTQLRAADWQDNDMVLNLWVEMMLNPRCR